MFYNNNYTYITLLHYYTYSIPEKTTQGIGAEWKNCTGFKGLIKHYHIVFNIKLLFILLCTYN
jgi:hypothetical protein